MNPARILTVTRRVLAQLANDKRTLAMIFVAPLFAMTIFGLAFSDGSQVGACAVNPSGGLFACGDPVGATGLMQAVFALWQLQGTVVKHFKDDTLQIRDARCGAIHSHAGTGTYVTVSILERESAPHAKEIGS